MKDNLKLVIPEELKKKYNNSLFELAKGKNTLIGNKEQLEMLDDIINNEEIPNGMILGEQGVGKTALVEQWLYNKSLTSEPVLIVGLAIETLAEIGDTLLISRMKTLLKDLDLIKAETKKEFPLINFEIVLFIDEVHKLNKYGNFNGSSGAMNALKEGTARAEGRVLVATTDYEYRANIATDLAFDRRFVKVILSPPTASQTKEILKRRFLKYIESWDIIPEIEENFYDELIEYTEAYIRDQINPAKSLKILSSALARFKTKYQKGTKIALNHDLLRYVFLTEGYQIDVPTTASHIKNTIASNIKGQPLAVKAITDTVNTSFYTKRNRNSPLITMFSVGTTGTGKSETAKLLALALFGRRDALLVLNGGDFSAPDDGIKAQNFIGDQLAVNKQVVILLDEIEKSHKNVLNAYMRMIDDGIVRDSLNTERSINSTALIATSNLGASIFSELAKTMRLDEIDNPDILTPELEEAWYRKEADVRKALQSGNKGENNGLRPEFLERFKLFVPYLPLAKKTIGQIARIGLLKFKSEMAEIGYTVQLPTTWNKTQWQKALPKTKHTDIDSISGMIAEDIVMTDASTAGARTINRFIENSVKVKVANEIGTRIEKMLSVNGAFRVKTNGQATFEGTSRGRPDVVVQYIERGDM